MSTVTFRQSLSTALGTVKLGTSLDALLAKATQLDPQPNSTGLDVNGDGVADGQVSNQLDAVGNLVGRQIYFTVNGASFAINDNNADGKVDGFQRIDAKGNGHSVGDSNFDGKADNQSEWTSKGTYHYFWDSNFDGKIDQRQDTRKATSKDQFVPLPAVPGFEAAQFGANVGDLIPANGKQISWTQGPSYNTQSWDTNGDWLADVTETQNLDANRQVTSTQVTLNQPANADGTPGASLTASDYDNDGKIDSLYGNTNGQWFSLSDQNHDGKLDGEQIGSADGSSKWLGDSNGDGKVDTVVTWSAVS